MKTFKNIIAVTLITLFALSCKNEAKPEVKTVAVENENCYRKNFRS